MKTWGLVSCFCFVLVGVCRCNVDGKVDLNPGTDLKNSTSFLMKESSDEDGVRYAMLLHTVYGEVFRLRDGSSLAGADTRALDTMLACVQRLLAVAPGQDILSTARSLPDSEMLRVLFLAVAGNFTVDQSPSALPQRCALVVDGQTGALILKDSKLTQSIILEVLLIVSIVCLMRSWAGRAWAETKGGAI